MRINLARLKQDLEDLGAIGRAPGGGVSRPSFSQADMEARGWLIRRIADAGLEARVDAAGNIFGRWQPGSPVVMVGSHIDSVPNGGMFDGALGVLVGLECLRRIKEGGARLRHPLELVAFTDEEGAFGGFFGSYAFTGVLKAEDIPNIRDSQGVRIIDAMARQGMDAMAAPSARRDPRGIRAYVELHIEQGPVLESRKIPVGVVDAIVGICRLGITFHGRADHAGTTPMTDRKDALLGAVDLIQQGREMVLAEGTPASRITVGLVQVKPGVANIVPAEAYLTYELREVSSEMLATLAKRSRDLAESIASAWGLGVSLETILDVPPVPLADEVKAAIIAATKELGLSHLRLPAMAGHDAQVVGRVAPAGMIFVPSKDGRSHSPLEFTSDEDLERGANVLLLTLLKLAGE
ncbi:MAG TPA: Zn-dependent hydrolase [Candidatus Methylomirabilis sp.]|nr:Zn-dependent hydrolase [Candidatus Methylomirabilis sp.]HSC71815.1 Zn-dependent hydrolase [Candidatus Methylomirabilis sp.]